MSDLTPAEQLLAMLEDSDRAFDMSDADLVDAVYERIIKPLENYFGMFDKKILLMHEMADRFMAAKGILETPKGNKLHGGERCEDQKCCCQTAKNFR